MVVSLAGFAGACYRNTFLMWLYLFVMFFVILALIVFIVFAYAVTDKGSGRIVPSRVYLDYHLQDYSGWLKDRVQEENYWSKIRSCIRDSKVCKKIRRTVGGVPETVEMFNLRKLSPIEVLFCRDFVFVILFLDFFIEIGDLICFPLFIYLLRDNWKWICWIRVRFMIHSPFLDLQKVETRGNRIRRESGKALLVLGGFLCVIDSRVFNIKMEKLNSRKLFWLLSLVRFCKLLIYLLGNGDGFICKKWELTFFLLRLALYESEFIIIAHLLLW